MTSQENTFASSTGQAMTEGHWLDVHFEAARPEYEARLRDVGIQAAEQVLNAGGGGSFLPWQADGSACYEINFRDGSGALIDTGWFFTVTQS